MSRTHSLLVLAAVALSGASSASAAGATRYAVSIHVGMHGVDSLVVAMIWGWVVTSAAAVVVGLIGGYLALRSGDVRQPLLLAFFLLYSLTLRIDNASLGWPWQFHLGMVVGRIGLGVNVVGAALLVWYLRAFRRPLAEPLGSSAESSGTSEAIAPPAAQPRAAADLGHGRRSF